MFPWTFIFHRVAPDKLVTLPVHCDDHIDREANPLFFALCSAIACVPLNVNVRGTRYAPQTTEEMRKSSTLFIYGHGSIV